METDNITYIKPILCACENGVSEMLSSVSGSITGILYNWQLIRHAGEDGFAAYGVVMYAAFVFIGVFAGYFQGSSPTINKISVQTIMPHKQLSTR